MKCPPTSRFFRTGSWTQFCPVVAAALLVSCAAGAGRTTTVRHGAATDVDSGNFTEAFRAIDEHGADAANRALRDSAARFEAQRGIVLADAGNLDGALRSLARATGVYTPTEIDRGGLPDELGVLARTVYDLSAERCDEAHALAAARVMMASHMAARSAAALFRSVAEWGENNRREFRTPWVSAGQTADVFKEAARVIPATDVLDAAGRFQLERRQAARRAGPLPPTMGRLGPDDMLHFGRSRTELVAAELAFLYLRLGELSRAADNAERLAEGSESTVPALVPILRALDSGEGGADGLARLAAQLDSIDRASSAGVCRRGRREYPTEPRFARCLADVASVEGEYGLASAHMEAVVRLAPGDATALETALRRTRRWFQDEMTREDLHAGRGAVARGRWLLTQVARGATAPTSWTAAELEYDHAQLELAHGNLAAAREHFALAVAQNPPSRSGYLALAEIAWRRNDPAEARTMLARGQALAVQPDESDSTFRPIFRVRVALATQAAGDAAGAHTVFVQAVSELDALVRSLDGEERARAFMLRAVARDALGLPTEARADLDAALGATSEPRDFAARAVVFSLSRGRWRDARELAEQARARFGPDSSARVYFALWESIAARLAGAGANPSVIESLLAADGSANGRVAWPMRLVQRWAGRIDRAQLGSYATTPGQRAEASFYEAMLEYCNGNVPAAESDLRAVVASELMHYSEYEIAWELLKRGLGTLRAGGASAAPAAASLTASSAR